MCVNVCVWAYIWSLWILLCLSISTVTLIVLYNQPFPFPLQLHDERTIIGKTLFKKETKIQAFLGLKVQLSTGCLPSLLTLFYQKWNFLLTSDGENSKIAAGFIIQVVFKPINDRRIFLFLGEVGVIEGTFGTSGKFRVSIPGITFHPGSHGLRLSSPIFHIVQYTKWESLRD